MWDKFQDKTKNVLRSKSKAYKKVFLDTEEGKYVLAEICRFAGLDRPSYVEGMPDRTAYNEGMKRVALHIKAITKQSDADIEKIMNNYKESMSINPLNQ